MAYLNLTINRIYRQEMSTDDVVKSHPAKIDHVREFSLRVTDDALGKLFDGSARLVGVMLIPHYYRHLYLKN